MKFVVLAGGSGSRLWPLSRDLYPKSLLNLYDGQSLIQNIYKMVLSLTNEKNILTVTNIRQVENIKIQLNEICNNPTVIAEPISKNTLSSIAAALHYLKGKKDEIVSILPVDFSVKSTNALTEAIEEAKLAAKKGYIAAIGVKPSYSEVGYGYIQKGIQRKSITPVVKFVEKPDLETASEFLKSEDYFWNCGIYTAKISVLLSEIEKFNENIFDEFSKEMFDENNNIDYKYYEKLPSVSIDYSVIEKSDKLAFVELKTEWNDYGSWREIYNNSKKDANNNVLQGNVISDNIKDSFIYSTKELVAVSSLKNTIVIDTEDAILVCDKNRASEINKLVEKIKKHYSEVTQIRKTVIRPWGIYTCLNKGKGWLTKIITVNPQHKLSLQSHNHRSEHWVVLEGCATVVLEDEIIELNKGRSINIPVKLKHSLQNKTDKPLKILEVQKGDYIDEDDIIRYEDIYGRLVGNEK